MKSIAAALLTIYITTNGQQIPEVPLAPPPPIEPGTGQGVPALIALTTRTPELPLTPPVPPIDPIPPTIPEPVPPIDPVPPSGTPGTPPIDPVPPVDPVVTPGTPPVDPAVVPPVTPGTPPVDPAAPAAPVDPAAPAPGTTATPVITPAPTTPAPTMNPYCTPGLAAMAQQAMLGNVGQGYTQCTSYTGPTSIATDMMGQLECVDGGCCMCSEISCGLSPGMPCNDIQFGDFSAAGVQNIKVKGSLAWNMGGLGNWQQGTQINCNGQQSCRAARIVGELIGEMQCSGVYGCNDANIIINDPAPQFNLHCDGEGGCAGANIEINIKNCASFAELGQFQFNHPMAAAGASITVNNYCTTPVIIEHLDCQIQGACQGTRFNFNGNVQIQNCEIFGAAQLPPQCLGFGGNQFGMGFPQFPMPQYPPMLPPQQPLPQYPLPAVPQQPQQPLPQPPVQAPPTVPQTPQQPAVPAPGTPQQLPPAVPAPGTPQQPAVPTPGFGQPGQPGPAVPVSPFGGFSVITGMGGQCEMPGQCRGTQQVTLQSNRFELSCIESGSCGGLALTLNVPPGGAVDTIEGFRFEAPFAAQGATITINSQMGFFAQPIEISRITCDVITACAGVTINAPGIDLSSLRIDCREQGACTGGTINGVSFDILSQGNFQGGVGFFPQPGFGAPQQQQPGFPQQPQQPQQPGFGAPQQPTFPQPPQQPGFGFPYYQI